jgi:hypothetical protein
MLSYIGWILISVGSFIAAGVVVLMVVGSASGSLGIEATTVGAVGLALWLGLTLGSGYALLRRSAAAKRGVLVIVGVLAIGTVSVQSPSRAGRSEGAVAPWSAASRAATRKSNSCRPRCRDLTPGPGVGRAAVDPSASHQHDRGAAACHDGSVMRSGLSEIGGV